MGLQKKNKALSRELNSIRTKKQTVTSIIEDK